MRDGKYSGVNPFMASFPHLIDVGIMGHCVHGQAGRCNVGCYQNGNNIKQPNMTLKDFKSIVRQCSGKVDQFALGGRGDPEAHENFVEILELCRDNGIIPNFTTSGYKMTSEIASKCWRCGAVAVSWYHQDYTYNAIETLIGESIKTNIHYVLNKHTIDEAIERLENDDFPKGINAVMFLLHKPTGLGKQDAVLHTDDARLQRFFALIDKNNYSFKVGIDSCTTPVCD